VTDCHQRGACGKACHNHGLCSNAPDCFFTWVVRIGNIVVLPPKTIASWHGISVWCAMSAVEVVAT
jgi:hypothetical protein